LAVGTRGGDCGSHAALFYDFSDRRHYPVNRYDNFTVAIQWRALEKFKEAGITDPRMEFAGKTIRVTGTITSYPGKRPGNQEKRPEIQVDNPGQITVISKGR
jgi:hypothetical protein